ncbi:hypothetical protein D3C86_1735450 [compost metagenome]
MFTPENSYLFGKILSFFIKPGDRNRFFIQIEFNPHFGNFRNVQLKFTHGIDAETILKSMLDPLSIEESLIYQFNLMFSSGKL